MRIETGVKVKNLTRAVAALGLGLAACVGLLSSGGQASAGVSATSLQGSIPAAAQVSKIDPMVLQETRDGKSASVMVLLSEKANLSAASGMRDADAQGWYVYNTLTAHANRTQAELKAFLSGQGKQFRSFWAVNSIEVTADRALVEALAARSDVGKIESNRPQRWIETPEVASYGVTNEPLIPGAIEWGVTNVNAPQVWALGHTGQGMVVGGQDTGIRWTHLAIKNQYRGWDGATANHNYNWWDAIHSGGGACGPDTQAPCDDNSYGTHTVGTTVGDDGTGNQIGVAPGAEWIGCRNMNVGNGTPATYTECFQFMIAPTDLAGQNPNPALRPHVLINSWSCPASEGCSPDSLLQVIENTSAAGIFVQFSAGNAGPGCGTVNTPGAIYEVSFSTGAYNISNALAGFSSRGPVTVDGSNRLKPNISAPGVNVRSATNASDTSYSAFSGTSMAGPHVSGVVALLWSARPHLVRDIQGTKNVLQNTANPGITVTAAEPYCGGTPPSQIPNNYFGYGRVDALAAYNASGATPTPMPTNTTVVPTNTAVPPTSTPGGATPTATACTLTFTDVQPTDTFYTWIRCLACRGIISGYSDGTFRPNNNITRGQIAKMVSGAAGFTEPVPTQMFEDVPPGSPFYDFIGRLAGRGHMGGYQCGLRETEPCVPPGNRPYFRPNENATRGQISKIVSNAAGFSEPVTGQFYADVTVDNPFYNEIMRLTTRGVMSGYPCGGVGEPCDSENRPYFRWGNAVTRGQASKIVANTFFPNCQTPRR
jgi:subtilisin family serine protease